MNLNKNILKRLMEIKNKGYAIFIASASPVFAIRLVIPDIPILGHDYQIKNKKYTGKTNNKMPIRQEKLKQLIEHINRMGSSEIEIAFSDSICDAPLLNYAKKSYLIKINKIEIWRKNSEIKQSKC
jgi:phosphoserine phosphatase